MKKVNVERETSRPVGPVWAQKLSTRKEDGNEIKAKIDREENRELGQKWEGVEMEREEGKGGKVDRRGEGRRDGKGRRKEDKGRVEEDKWEKER